MFRFVHLCIMATFFILFFRSISFVQQWAKKYQHRSGEIVAVPRYHLCSYALIFICSSKFLQPRPSRQSPIQSCTGMRIAILPSLQSVAQDTLIPSPLHRSQTSLGGGAYDSTHCINTPTHPPMFSLHAIRHAPGSRHTSLMYQYIRTMMTPIAAPTVFAIQSFQSNMPKPVSCWRISMVRDTAEQINKLLHQRLVRNRYPIGTNSMMFRINASL